jgi:hypothetical protein
MGTKKEGLGKLSLKKETVKKLQAEPIKTKVKAGGPCCPGSMSK